MAKEDDKKVEQTSEKETTDTKDTKEQEPAPDEGDGGSSDTASSDDAAGSTEGEDGKTKEEAVMLLNHKDALDFILSDPNYLKTISVRQKFQDNPSDIRAC